MSPFRSLVAAAVAALSLNAHAGIVVPTDGSWAEFDFDAQGSSLYDLATLDTGFTFDLSQAGILRVLDAGFSGDRYEIFANGVSLGLTSIPVAQNVGEEPLFDTAELWNDTRFSRGEWYLGAGSYTLTGIATLVPEGAGYGYLSVTNVATVDEPPLPVLLATLGLVGAIFGRRQSLGKALRKALRKARPA
jgi:hypothetical protein